MATQKVPAGNGLLEIQVPEGTAIRVDGEYLGMGPGRRVPLSPGPHEVTLGDGAPQSVLVKAGQRTLAVVGSAFVLRARMAADAACPYGSRPAPAAIRSYDELRPVAPRPECNQVVTRTGPSGEQLVDFVLCP